MGAGPDHQGAGAGDGSGHHREAAGKAEGLRVTADGLAETEIRSCFPPKGEDGFFQSWAEPGGSMRQPTDLKSGRRKCFHGR